MVFRYIGIKLKKDHVPALRLLFAFREISSGLFGPKLHRIHECYGGKKSLWLIRNGNSNRAQDVSHPARTPIEKSGRVPDVFQSPHRRAQRGEIKALCFAAWPIPGQVPRRFLLGKAGDLLRERPATRHRYNFEVWRHALLQRLKGLVVDDSSAIQSYRLLKAAHGGLGERSKIAVDNVF